MGWNFPAILLSLIFIILAFATVAVLVLKYIQHKKKSFGPCSAEQQECLLKCQDQKAQCEESIAQSTDSFNIPATSSTSLTGHNAGPKESNELPQKTNKFSISEETTTPPDGAIALPPETISFPHAVIAIPLGVVADSSGNCCYLAKNTPNTIHGDIWLQGTIEDGIDLGEEKIYYFEEECFQENGGEASKNKTKERNEVLLEEEEREDGKAKVDKEKETEQEKSMMYKRTKNRMKARN